MMGLLVPVTGWNPKEVDPYFASVVLLLHGDGTDGSTTITDNSGSAHSPTVNGNSQIDTAESQFGGASVLFDGSGDYLEYADSADWDFGTGDFTVEFWMRRNAWPTSGNLG